MLLTNARKSNCLRIAIIPLLLTLAAGTSRADILSFFYNSSGSVLSGTLNGTIQPDGNQFFVTSMGNVDVDGNAGPDLPFIDTPDDIFGAGPTLPIVTVDGSFMDFFACTDNTCTDGFFFAAGDVVAAIEGSPVFLGGASFGNALTLFDATGWSAVVPETGGSPVPEPSSLCLGLTAVAALALVVRRRRRLAQPV